MNKRLEIFNKYKNECSYDEALCDFCKKPTEVYISINVPNSYNVDFLCRKCFVGDNNE